VCGAIITCISTNLFFHNPVRCFYCRSTIFDKFIILYYYYYIIITYFIAGQLLSTNLNTLFIQHTLSCKLSYIEHFAFCEVRRDSNQRFSNKDFFRQKLRPTSSVGAGVGGDDCKDWLWLLLRKHRWWCPICAALLVVVADTRGALRWQEGPQLWLKAFYAKNQNYACCRTTEKSLFV
jgi:hypothetical protein